MDMATVRNFLLWSTLINYGLLLWWFLFFMFAHDWMYRFHGRWFQLSVQQFDAIHYGAMAFYKIIILVFNLVPLVILCLNSIRRVR